MTTSNKIKNLREAKHLTQEEMAQKMYIHANTYGRLERGETKMTEHRLEQVAGIFDVNVADILATPEDKVIFLIAENKLSENSGNINLGYVNEMNHYDDNKSKIQLLTEKINALNTLLEEKEKRLNEKDDLIKLQKEKITLLQNLVESKV